MSDLLMTWLNDEIQLSRRVTNFEADFQNGYLFGELLAKYNQQLNFNEFVNKNDKSSKMSNFSLLFDTFKALRVTFNSNIAMQILDQHPGIAKKVLYELKMQLQKTNSNSNAFAKIPKGTKTLSPLKRIQDSKQKFDSLNRSNFEKLINQVHKPQKYFLQKSVLQKFEDFQSKQVEINHIQEQHETTTKLMERKKFYLQRRNNMKNSVDFRTEWEKEGAVKHVQNMTVRQEQKEKDLLYRTSIENKYVQKKVNTEERAVKALEDDIKKFEKKFLQKSDSDSETEEGDPKKQLVLDKSASKLSSKLGMAPTFPRADGGQILGKKKKAGGEQHSRHQREKRRRKMIVEQNKRHQMIEINRRERCIIAALQQTSKQEKELEYQIWRAYQNKDIIIQNRNLVDEKQKQKEETRTINAKFKDEELLKTLRAEHANELNDALARQNKLSSDNRVTDRKTVYNDCRKVIDEFIDLTETCYNFGQQKNKSELEEDFLNQLLAEFVVSAASSEQTAKIQLKNYIKGEGLWKIHVKRENDEIPTDPTVQNAVPAQSVNNVYLGNILKTVFSKAYTSKENQRNLESESLNDKFCASLLGLQFCGKKQVASSLKLKYGVNIIVIEELIQKRLEQYQMMKERNLETSRQTEELAEKCYTGADIPNNLIVSLLEDELKNNPKSVIVDYPITYDQATQLSKNLAGIEPHDMIQSSRLAKKIQSFSRLAEPTPSVVVPSSIKPCGIDFALWIDISPKTSFDRFLGRRWIAEDLYHINDQIPDVNQLTVREKASPTILTNNFKIVNKEKMERWFKNFGIELNHSIGQQNSQRKVLSSWSSIDGQCSKEELLTKAVQIFGEALQIKNSKKKSDNSKRQEKEENEKNEELKKGKGQQAKGKCVMSSGEQIREELENARSKVDFEGQFLEAVTNAWDGTESNTINCLLESFKQIRRQQEQMNCYIADLKRSYILLLTRSDEKLYLAKEFQNKYNRFFDEQNEMIGYEHTKEELHQRVQDLEEEMLTIVQTKKEEAIEERNNVMGSGWLQSQLEKFYLAIQLIVQAELHRTTLSQQLIQDFYSKKYMLDVPPCEETPTEITLDSSLEIYREDSSPRLERLIAEALRLFNREEDAADDKNKKGGKGAKKEDKKAAKKGGKEEPEQKAQPTPQELQMKKAINTEKAIFRYRTGVVKDYALKRIREIFQSGQSLYSNLEDLYLLTNRVENNSVFNLTKIIRRAIQKQLKIENEVQINYVQVLETQFIRNFEKPKPIISPAKEESRTDRFTISSLNQIMNWFKKEAEGQDKISNRRLITLFHRFTSNSSIRNLLPDTWKALKMENYEHLIRLLDPRHEGQIQLWKIFIFLIMSNFRIPTSEALQKYRLVLKNYNTNTALIDRQDFLKGQAWFDSQQNQIENVRVFDRAIYIKNSLFDLFKNTEDDSIHVDRFLDNVGLAKLSNPEANKCKTYYDFGFQLFREKNDSN